MTASADHKEDQWIKPARMKGLHGCPHPAIVNGQTVVIPYSRISAGFAYPGIDKENKNRHN